MPIDTHPSAVTRRIAAIREALADGGYPIDLDLLASRIVDDELRDATTAPEGVKGRSSCYRIA